MTRAELAAPPCHDPVPGWRHSVAAGAPGIELLHIEFARRSAPRFTQRTVFRNSFFKDRPPPLDVAY